MSTLLKSLNEQRGAELKKAQEIRTKLETEKRGFTEEERTEIRGINDRVDAIDKDIEAEVRTIANLSKQAPRLSKQEERDLERFDISKVLRHLHRSAKGAYAGQLDGIEAELIQEGEREARAAGIETAGIMLPSSYVRRENRDMTASGTTSTTGDQGGMTIATEKRGLLDDFFKASVTGRAGALRLEGLMGNVDLPRIVAGTDPAKKAENASADEVSPTMAMLSLSPKRLPAYIDLSERLLMQSSVGIEAFLRNHLSNQLSAIQQVAFFHGGGTNEPLGIAGTSGIGSVAGGPNGAAPTWTHIVALETAVDTSDALLGSLHYVSNGQIRGKLKTTPKVSSTDSMMILDDRAGNLLNGYEPLFTNAVSRTLTKGSSGAVASAIFFGNFADFVEAYWGGISLELVRDKTNAISGLYTLVASAYYDGGVLRPKSFAAMLDALGA